MSRKTIAITTQQFLAAAQGCCNSCEHWNRDDSYVGECRRYPPQIIIGVDDDGEEFPMSMWPSTENVDGCGEFKASQ